VFWSRAFGASRFSESSMNIMGKEASGATSTLVNLIKSDFDSSKGFLLYPSAVEVLKKIDKKKSWKKGLGKRQTSHFASTKKKKK
jgi:hypothetical protein